MNYSKNKRGTKRWKQGKTSVGPIMLLAFWQVRQTWRLLLMIGVGMLASVVFVCAVPLYAQVAATAGLRAAIATPDNSILSINGQFPWGTQPDLQFLNRTTDHMNHLAQQDAGDTITSRASFTSSFSNLSVPHLKNVTFKTSLLGLPQQEIAAHMRLTAGHWPQPTTDGVIEIVLQQQGVDFLKHELSIWNKTRHDYDLPPLDIGSEFVVETDQQYPIFSWFTSKGGMDDVKQMTVRVVGYIDRQVQSDPGNPLISTAFFQAQAFTDPPPSDGITVIFNGLVSPEAFFPSLQALSHTLAPPSHATMSLPVFKGQIQLYWHYSLKFTSLTVNNASTFLDELDAFSSDSAQLIQANPSSTTLDDTFHNYLRQITEAQLPILLLAMLLVGLVILFTVTMVNLLIERQGDAIALLRSRGASRAQIFAIFALQCLLLSLVALCLGPLLAIPTAHLLGQRLLPLEDQGALSMLRGNSVAIAWQVGWYAVAALSGALLAVLLTIFSATNLDVLALRRQAARSTRRPFWQRLRLDLLLGVLALASYIYILYALNNGIFDPTTAQQLLSPLILLTATLILLVGLLFFLRAFPGILDTTTRLVARGRGAPSLLALAQMARTPRQALRMTLLFSLTTAFVIFTLIFTASQTQRTVDIASYEVGADFSASVQADPRTPQQQFGLIDQSQTAHFSFSEEQALFQKLPGVQSVTLGTILDTQLQEQGIHVIIKAVDTSTFANTTSWSGQDSAQAPDVLMQQLTRRNLVSSPQHLVPALVEPDLWQNFHMTNGSHFTLHNVSVGDVQIDMSFMAVNEVQHIPTLLQSATNTTSSTRTVSILVDYQSLATVYQANTGSPLPYNYIWVRTQDDAATQARVIRTLQAQLAPGATLLNRRQLLSTLQHDPLYLGVLGVLTIGTFLPLLLSLLGSLLVSWLTAQQRLTVFALLRALGSAPQQLASMLGWEQGIVYGCMVVLGTLAGALLSLMVLPVLLLTNVVAPDSPDSASSSSAQTLGLPSIHIVLPPSLGFTLLLLLLISLLTVGTIIYLVSRPSMSQTLRLNTD